MNNTVESFKPNESNQVDREAISAYQRDGVICLRSALQKPWLDVIEQGIEQYFELNNSNEDAKNVAIKHQGDKGNFYYATLMWKEYETFRKVIFESPAARLFGSLLETDQLNLYYDFLLIKEAGCKKAITPWHQDHSYYCLHGRKIINCWIALDTIPRETALRFIQGSHNDYDIHRAVHFSPGKEYPGLIKDRPLPPNFDQDESVEILSTDLRPGDALVWNSRTFHSAPGNILDQRRAALSLNFCGDDVRYFNMGQEPDPPIRGEDLVEGGHITCESFPLLQH